MSKMFSIWNNMFKTVAKKNSHNYDFYFYIYCDAALFYF
jgi:hypothetical protein